MSIKETDCIAKTEWVDENLAYELGGETRYYKSIWHKIEDQHYSECPTAIGARACRISTLCMCDKIESALDAGDECHRCHKLAEVCACGARAQVI